MPAAGDIWQVTYQTLLHGTTCENVLHFRGLTGLETDAALAAAAERFWFFQQALCSNQLTFSQMIIKRMTPIALDERIAFPTTVNVGAVGSGTVNSTIAAIFTLRTGTAGKSHRGRIYIAGLSTNFVSGDNATYNTGGAAAATTFATALVSEFGAAGTNASLRLGIYSRVIGGVHPFTLAGWQQMSAVDPQPVLGNQRRRRLGVGI